MINLTAEQHQQLNGQIERLRDLTAEAYAETDPDRRYRELWPQVAALAEQINAVVPPSTGPIDD